MNYTSIQAHMRLFLKRKWLIIGIIIGVTTAAWVACEFVPKQYKSTTMIVVESQRVPENVVKGVVSGTVRERLGTIRQLMLSRKLLTDVIKQVELDRGRAAEAPVDDLVENLRKNIEITTTRDEAFSVSFRHGDPYMAMHVTKTLAEMFIDVNLNNREQLVSKASEFLLGELKAAEIDLEAKEKLLAEFKMHHMGELPGQMEANLRALDRLQSDVSSRTETLHKLAERLNTLDRAIQDYETTGSTSSGVPVPVKQTRQQALAAQLQESQQRLDKLSAVYKETYPDIVSLKEEIVRIKSAQAQPDVGEPVVATDANGHEQKKVPQDQYLRELLRQQQEVKTDMEITREAQAKLKEQIKVYEARVENTPAREQQLMTIMRDYDNMQRSYQSLLEKRSSARIAENLEKKQQGEQFHIIDQANLPDIPEWPKRQAFLLAGFALGCLLAFGSVKVLDQLRVGFTNSEEAELFLGIPVLGTISDFRTVNKSLSLPSFQDRTGRLLSSERNGEKSETLVERTRTNGSVAPSLKSLDTKNTQIKKAAKGYKAKWNDELNFITRWNPNSIIAEQYRVAATRLALMNVGAKSTVILVTSTLKMEGKTSSSLNLGYVLAHDLGKSTLIIDCDYKNPSLHEYAGIQPEPGLTSILLQNVAIETCMRKLDPDPLWLLPAGRQMDRPVQLHHVEKLRAMLSILRDQYEYIILDATPVFPMADINVLSSMADLLAMIVRVSETKKEVVQKALAAIAVGPKRAALLTGLAASDTPSYLTEPYYIPHDKSAHV